jgi:hypothetical protein
LDKETEIFSLDENGNIQATDIHTGEVRVLESALSDPTATLNMASLRRIRAHDGTLVYVSPRISAEDLQAIQGQSRTFPYTAILGDQICEMVAEGRTLVDISREEGMPSYSEIARWRVRYPEFNRMYAQARKDRAEIYFHRILEEIERVSADRDDIALARLKTDIYKFAAKVSAPDEYAEKSTIDAKIAVGTFAIETGIRREGDPGFNKDETKLLAEEDNGSNQEEEDTEEIL